MYGLMLLPASVLIIPRYLVFAKLNWVDTYLPFWIPAAMATSSFFIYMGSSSSSAVFRGSWTKRP